MGKVLKLIKTSSVNLMTSPARCTLRNVRSLSPALAVSLSFNPFTYIGRTAFQLNSVGFATRQKPYGVTIQQRYVLQVQSQAAPLVFQIEQSLQLRHVLRLNSAAECKHHFSVC